MLNDEEEEQEAGEGMDTMDDEHMDEEGDEESDEANSVACGLTMRGNELADSSSNVAFECHLVERPFELLYAELDCCCCS